MNLDEIKKKNQEKFKKDKKLVLWLLPLVVLVWGVIIAFESSSVDYKYAENTPEGTIERAVGYKVARNSETVNKIVEIKFSEQFEKGYEGKNLVSIEYLATIPILDTKEEVLQEVFKILGKIGKVNANLNIGEVFLRPHLPLKNSTPEKSEGQISKIVFPFEKAVQIDPADYLSQKSNHLEKLFSKEGRSFKWMMR